MSVTDLLGRPLRDLRISVTDRCNFRCTYCMPREVFGPGFRFLPRSELLTFEEITRLARQFVANGVEKLRLTGGEPLLRRDLANLVSMLSVLPGLSDLALTTNGSLLAQQADDLAAAGLRRVTVSLDSLDDAIFAVLNDVDFPVAKVLAGIDAAERAGLMPIKINMVVRRGVNDSSILPMAREFRARGHVLRFIEYMDVGSSNRWKLDEVVPAADLLAMIDAELPVEPIEVAPGAQVAERWRYRDGGGEIGIIASVTRPFCATCTRARLTAEGVLYTCLFGTTGHDLRAPLRAGESDGALAERVAAIWRGRADRYSELRAPAARTVRRVEMSHIGG